MDPTRRAEIRTRLEAASPGPWRTATDNMLGSTSPVIEGPKGDICRPYRHEDARFIAHARDDVGDLLDALDEVRAARAADEDLLRRVFSTLHVGRRHALLWTIVMDVFGIGSTSAQELCARLGYDPDQRVGRGYPAQRESAEEAR